MLHITPETTELRVYQTAGADVNLTDPAITATNVAPDVTIPGEHIESADLTQRLADRKDTGSLTINNATGQYTDALTVGDRFELLVTYALDTVDAWGDGAWGAGHWGGPRIEWTGWVGDRTLERLGPDSHNLVLECDDFVFGVFDERTTDAAFENGQVVGGLVEVIADDAPEVRVSADRSFAADLDTNFSGTSLFDAVGEILRRGTLAGRAHRDMIEVSSIDPNEVVPRFTVDGARDIGLFDNRETDADLVNAVRIDGGKTAALDAQQTEFDHWERVYGPDESLGGVTTPGEEDTEPDEAPDPGNRVVFTVETRKSEIAEVHIYTRNASEDRLTVRLQHDDPNVEVENRESDLAQRTLDHRFISKEDWTTFIMPTNDLPAPNPRVIVESDGTLGHFLGIGADGPMHQVYYPYNIITRQEDQSSIDAYREREHRIVDGSITRFEDATALADEVIAHYARPERTVHTTAESVRASLLHVGQVVELDFASEAAVGEYIVVERTLNLDGIRATIDLSLREVVSL